MSDEMPEYMREAAEDGFEWTCACGEMHRTAKSAYTCRKCRKYLPEGRSRYAENVLTDERLEGDDFGPFGRPRDAKYAEPENDDEFPGYRTAEPSTPEEARKAIMKMLEGPDPDFHKIWDLSVAFESDLKGDEELAEAVRSAGL